MSGRLRRERVEELLAVAINLGLHDRREALLFHIPETLKSNMPAAGPNATSRDRLARDLYFLNDVGLLNDGTDPLHIYLENAHYASGTVADAEVFREACTELAQPATRPQAPQFLKLSGATWLPSSGHPEFRQAVVHRDAHIPARFLADAQRASESVALVCVPRLESGQKSTVWASAKGTGWLIGPDLLITAYHVVNARRDDESPATDADFTGQALSAEVTFGHARPDQPGTVLGVTELVAWSEPLDYAIMRLGGAPGVSPLRLAGEVPAISDDSHPPLNVIACPADQPKVICLRNSLATTVTERPTDLGYFTAIDQGTAGAPVFSDDWRVVALHRATAEVAEIMFQGLPTAWANVGTRITAIQEDLRSRYRQVWDLIQVGQAAEPRSPIASSPAVTTAQRLHRSTEVLREKIRAIVDGCHADGGVWVWQKAPLREELDRVERQVVEVEARLDEDEQFRAELHDALNRHGGVADQFARRISELDARQVSAQRSLRARDFELAGESLLDVLMRIEEQLRLLEPGYNSPGTN